MKSKLPLLLFSLIQLLFYQANAQYYEIENDLKHVFSNYADQYVAIHDFNNDGLTDLLLGGAHPAQLNKTPLFLLINQGNGTFLDQTSEYFEGQIIACYPIGKMGDINGDGDLDLVIFDGGNIELGQPTNDGFMGEEPQLWIYENGKFHLSDQLARAYEAEWPFNPKVHVKDFDLGDIDNDGDLDIIVESQGGHQNLETHFALNNGDGTFKIDSRNNRLPWDIVYSPNWEQGVFAHRHAREKLADMDGDGHLDIVMGQLRRVNNQQDDLYSKVVYNNGTGFFKHGNTHHIDLPYVNWNGTYTYVKSITLKDFDNDNDLDILFGHERGNNSTLQNGNTGLYLQFLRNDGNQTFTDITSQHFLNNAILLAEKYSDDQNNYNMAVLEFFDMNNDGHEDIVMTKAYAPIRENAPFIFLNDGNDFYKPVDHEIINNESEWFGEKAYPIDLNNDGLLDIVTLDVRPGPDNDYNTGDEYSELIPIIALKAIGLESTSSGSAKILLYPNPSNSNTVFIKNQSDFTNAVFELNTLSGSLVFSDILMTSNNEYIELKIPDLKAGIYILSIKTDFEVYTAKLILNN